MIKKFNLYQEKQLMNMSYNAIFFIRYNSINHIGLMLYHSSKIGFIDCLLIDERGNLFTKSLSIAWVGREFIGK